LERVPDVLLLRAASAIFGRREIVQLVDGLREQQCADRSHDVDD
jgi:hypothetical protein